MFLSLTTTTARTLLTVGLFIAVLLPSFSQAALVQVELEGSSYGLGQTFTASLVVNPTGESVNAVRAHLKFDPSILSVTEISKTNSVLTNWIVEPTYSNSSGTIDLAGISEFPFTTSANVLTITFVTLASGNGEITIADASAYATDGLRTDVFSGSVPALFVVSETLDQYQENLIAENPLADSALTSKEFTNPNVWYQSARGTFTWDLPAGTEAVAAEVTEFSDNRPNNNPNAIYETPISEFAITPENISDGIHHLSVRFRDSAGWGEVYSRQLLVDTTAPEPFFVEVDSTNSAAPILRFEALDLTSGIAGYEVEVNENGPTLVSSSQAKLGYELSGLADGAHVARVTAFDLAGNAYTVTVEFVVIGSPAADSTHSQSEYQRILSVVDDLYIYILAIIIVLLLVHLYFERKQMRLKEEKLAKETHEIQEQTEKIFSALRDEIYEQINTITKRKRLSKAEKEAVDGLNQAIEVSETLIEKEINDVKKALK